MVLYRICRNSLMLYVYHVYLDIDLFYIFSLRHSVMTAAYQNHASLPDYLLFDRQFGDSESVSSMC